MKLRNKKTGIIRDFIINKDKIQTANSVSCWEYSTLAELLEEWEDYQEPETYYYISDLGNIESLTNDHGQNLPEEIWRKAIKRRKEIGNHFETEEETEKAVEKLKAWKRLKDKGFKFNKWYFHDILDGDVVIIANFKNNGENDKDLDLLFGGER